MKSSLSDNNIYPSICQLAVDSDDFFLSFKKDERYREILEHTSFSQGTNYFDIIKRDNPYLLDSIAEFKRNDLFGCPDKYQYDVIGEISPSTLRYIKILSDLKKLFGNLNGFDIVEIGGGYGGQCKIISDIFKFKSYDILDLKSVSNLINKYLSKLDVKNAKAYPIEDYLCKDKYNLIISNYAFSELNRDVQNGYLDKIINKCDHGYMICNMINNFDSFSKDELVGMNKNIKVIEEEPKTHQNNFVIYW